MTARWRSPNRRDWLRSALAVTLMGRTGLASFRADAVEQIRAKGRAAQMAPFDTSESVHFLGVGDAPAQQRGDALALCEAFAADYFVHFRAKGFTLDWPTARLPVVILAGSRSYAAFEKGFGNKAVGGHFDLDANWLVTFDFGDKIRGMRPAEADEARLNNTLTLVHETLHQLSYNTGLLDRTADIPLCIIEGLANYAETWRPAHKGTIGAINVRRRRGLELAQRDGARWLPISRLLGDDGPLNDEKTQQVAYAESALLVHKLLRDPVRLPQFRAYLKAAPKSADPRGRVALAATHFGDLDKLDREIRR